jgi:hypothetical protein
MGAKDEYPDSFKRGDKAEREFKSLMLKNGGVKDASVYDNMKKHIDQYVFIDGKKISVDVKGVKSVDRGGILDDSKHYVEEVNVNGEPGWLFGKSDYFSFQTNDYWVIVSRDKLQEFIKTNCTDSTIYEKKFLYKRYGRSKYGKKDVIIIVETEKLKELSTWILDRDKTYVDIEDVEVELPTQIEQITDSDIKKIRAEIKKYKIDRVEQIEYVPYYLAGRLIPPVKTTEI